MKVLYLTFDDLSKPYAWSVHVRAIVNGLEARGHDVRLIASPPGRFQHLAGSLGTFVRAGREFGPDVVYVRGIHATVTPALAAGRLDRPFVVEVNGLLEEEVDGWRRAAVRASHRFTLARAARIVTVSPVLAEALARRYGAGSERIDVIPNGADVRLFRPGDRGEARRRLGLPADGPIVLCVASFYPHHALEVLVHAAREAKALLVLVGGEARKSDGVLGVGPVPHERVPDYVAAADVCAYVLRAPHRDFGFSPLKVYEYMAGGRAVAAATDREDLRAFVNDSGVGVGVPLDGEALAGALRRLLADPAERERAGRRGRELAESTYSWDRAVGQVEQSLSRAASRHEF